jgi:hypothetical protein
VRARSRIPMALMAAMPRPRRTRISALVPLVAAVYVLACGDDGGPVTSVEDSIALHAYSLHSVGGQTLPVPTDRAGDGSPMLLIADTLRFGGTPFPPETRLDVFRPRWRTFDPPRVGQPPLPLARTGYALQEGDEVRIVFPPEQFGDTATSAIGNVSGSTVTLRYTPKDGVQRPEVWVYLRYQ